ncbi:MAG: hypothetical protein U0271_46145 [Polyangiaceae bacterium]
MRHHVRGSELSHIQALAAVTLTLDRMAAGGMYDQLGGGFARYSTDEKWHVPHFEKMLYDNAQLARVYTEAWQLTGEARFRRVATETLDYVLREMQGEHGGYFSATDADSEGVEGKFFTWSKAELDASLEPEVARAAAAAWDVSEKGNWTENGLSTNVLWLPRALDEVAKELGLSREELDQRLAKARATLFELRQKRVPPLCDDKVLTSWNSLMIGAMAFAGRAFGEPRYVASAERAAARIAADMIRPDGGLYRVYRAEKAHIDGFLEDYAFFADALVDLYEATGEAKHLALALRLVERATIDFGRDDGASDVSSQGFYTTARDAAALIVRMRDDTDNATPSANAILSRALVRLAAHCDREDLRALAEGAIRAHGRSIQRAPRAFASSIDVLSRLVSPPVEIALVGKPDAPETIALDRALGRAFLPWSIVARLDPSAPAAPLPHPLLRDKALVDGAPAAYVCRDFACKAPVTTAEALTRELDEARALTASARAERLEPKAVVGAATISGTAKFVGPEGDKPSAWAGSFSGLTIHRAGVLVTAYREQAARETVLRALELGRNLIAFDAARASAVGDAVAQVASTRPRAELVFAGLLEGATAEELTRAAARMTSEARLEALDLALVHVRDLETSIVAARALVDSPLAHHVGLALDEPLSATVVSALPDFIKVLAAPLNLTEGDPAALDDLAARGVSFFALRPTDVALQDRMVRLGAALEVTVGPPLAALLGALAALENEYRRTIAVHLRVDGNDELDPSELLLWSEELGRAERDLDDALEVEAFLAQAVGPALNAQFGALSAIGGELAPRVASLRERYMSALDQALKGLARKVAGRHQALVQNLAGALAADASLLVTPAAASLAAVLAQAGVTAALTGARDPRELEASRELEPTKPEALLRARARVLKTRTD